MIGLANNSTFLSLNLPVSVVAWLIAFESLTFPMRLGVGTCLRGGVAVVVGPAGASRTVWSERLVDYFLVFGLNPECGQCGLNPECGQCVVRNGHSL